MQIKLLVLMGLIMIVLMGICLIYAEQIITPAGIYVDQYRAVDGSVTFTVRTVTYNGSYGPRNAGAIWITNSSNQFVKTLKIWASEYRSALVRWRNSSGNNTTGAITSASLNNHQLHTVTWNSRNVAGTVVEDGNYNINVEFAEHNASSSNMGKYKTVLFNKGHAPADQTFPNETWFRDMHLSWNAVANDDPSAPSLELSLDQNYPNPFKQTTTIRYQLPKAAPAVISIYNLRGQKLTMLAANTAAKGWNEVVWDGKDASGKRVAAGTYFYVLSYQDRMLYNKLIIR